jgi:PEGA domain
MRSASMRTGLATIVALGSLAATSVVAQRLPPLPPVPVSLEVPRPIPPVSSTPPRDLYQQPTQPPVVPYPPGILYGTSAFALSVYTPSLGTAPPAPIPPAARGGLRFETSPGFTEVLVDGFLVGTIDDFGISGRPLDLEAGPHRVELRAAGYATRAFEVHVVANDTTRFRGDLQQLTPPPAPAAAATIVATATKTTYIIPRCYAGDRPPVGALPPGCNLRDMLVQKR